MDEIVFGRVHSFDADERVLTIKRKKRIMYYYLQRSLMKRFSQYLVEGIFVTFKIENNKQLIRGKSVYIIDHFLKIAVNTNIKNKVYYDTLVIKEGIRDLVNSLDNKMYLDVEMTMQNFGQRSRFTQELLQVGLIIDDANGNLLEEASIYIKPILHPNLNERTKQFLGVTQKDVDRGLNAKEFHEQLKYYMDKYKPTIIVWGANDYLAIENFYRIIKKKAVVFKNDFLDLLKLHKNYYDLKNDLGLFKALKMYNKEYDEEQLHDALDDARVTREIFYEFKKIIND